MELREYTTERGVTVRVVPIPLLLDAIREAHSMPATPTYTEHLAGGATEETEITPEMAATWAKENPESWADHAEMWAAYEVERNAVQELLNERLWEAAMRRAIQVDMPGDDDWVEEHRALGLTVPDAPKDRRIHYIRTEVIGGMADVLKITAMANGADLSEEALSLAEASFRGSLAQSLLTGLTA